LEVSIEVFSKFGLNTPLVEWSRNLEKSANLPSLKDFL